MKFYLNNQYFNNEKTISLYKFYKNCLNKNLQIYSVSFFEKNIIIDSVFFSDL